MKMITILMVALLVIVTVGCATDGSGRIQPATATNTTASTAQTVRDQETAGGTYMGIGGDVTYNIHPKPGVTVPERVTEAVAKVLESEATMEVKTKFLEALGKVWGFTVEINMTDARSGNVDLAGQTGRGGVPPATEPDEKDTGGD
jgi:hypothetical protein